MKARKLSQLLGVSESTVSRLLSGDRGPSLQLMWRMESCIKWPIVKQSEALKVGPVAYGQSLEKVMLEYEPEEDSVPAG